MKLLRGYFLTVEGADCSGKSSITKHLEVQFTRLGYDVEVVADLYSTDLGVNVRNTFLDHNATLEPMSEALLIFAARVELIQKKIIPALKAGKIVIADRFTDTTFVYQGTVKGVGENTIGLLETLCQASFRPDQTILAVASADTIMGRLAIKKNKDKHELLPREFHEGIIAGFGQRLMHNRSRFFPVSTDTTIEAAQEQLEGLIKGIHESLKVYVKA